MIRRRHAGTCVDDLQHDVGALDLLPGAFDAQALDGLARRLTGWSGLRSLRLALQEKGVTRS